MNFINLQVFWWIPVILIFMGLMFWYARVRRSKIMRLILGSRANDSEHVQLSLARRLFRFLLLCFGMLMLIMAIARPTWDLQLVPYQSRGRDLMVLFDVSKSMLAQDIRPSRLAHAKLFLRDLVNNTGSDRFGLVAFAGRAFLECPMTTDKASFIQYVDELDTQSIPLGGTNLQLALETAMKAFDAAEGNNRAIILITDGDELSGNSKLVLSELKKANIPLLVVGVGGSATPALIPIPQGSGKNIKFMRDSKGELVKTRLNVTLMQQLADSTGGYFVHSTTTNFGLTQIEAGIKKLLPAELEKGEKTRPVEHFYYFLAFATILLWLWMLISEHPGKKRKYFKKATAIFMISALFAVQNTANAQNPGSQPKLPVTKTTKPEEAPLTDPVKAYNEAREIQVNKKKGDSSKLYETAINLAGKNPAVRTNSFNNLGVKQHQKARQTVGQARAQVKKQNLDGAISQLEGSKKILDLAEEMYIKALSTDVPEQQTEDKKVSQESARNQSAVNQQLLLNDRARIDKLIKQIKELKKQQKKAQKQTKKAQKQQQKKNKDKKQDKKQQQKKKQDKKQDKKQQQKKKQDKKQQDKKQQDKKQQDKKQQNKKQQDKKQQDKKQQDKKQQNKKQQQKPNDELKKAQNDVNKLEKQAKDLGQKKIEDQAKKAKKELKKAEKSRKEKQGKKAEEHIKKALEELKPKGSDKKKKNKDKKGKGKDKKKDKGKDKKKDKGKDGKDKKDKKLPKPQAQPAQQGKAKKAPKDIDPKEARKLLKLMNEKEKDFRKALKAHRKQMYKNIKVKKDW